MNTIIFIGTIFLTISFVLGIIVGSRKSVTSYRENVQTPDWASYTIKMWEKYGYPEDDNEKKEIS